MSESHAPEDPQTNEGTPRARAARPQARARAAHPQAEPAVAEAPEFSMVLPATKDGRLKEIMSFMKGFQDLKEDTQIRQAMRMRLACFSNTCRLNVYWSRTAVGLTCRAEKTDLAYFQSRNKVCPEKFRMAAAHKAAEMLATCRRLFLVSTNAQLQIYLAQIILFLLSRGKLQILQIYCMYMSTCIIHLKESLIVLAPLGQLRHASLMR